MRWTLGVAAACALVVATGACGSQITVPDQGIIVTGCQQPARCYRNDCTCYRVATLGNDMGVAPTCTTAAVCADPNDPSTCDCPVNVVIDADMHTSFSSECVETAQACIGRGVLCGGVGALCKPVGATCDGTGDPPMLIPTFGMPALEPHCQFVDDVCCPGTSDDGGMSPSDGGMPMSD